MYPRSPRCQAPLCQNTCYKFTQDVGGGGKRESQDVTT